MSSTKTYSTKAAAKLGAKRQELNIDALSFLEDKEGRWSWEVTADLEQAEEETEQPTIGTDLESKAGTGIKIEKDRPEKFGIVRPSEGGKCRAVWDECDALLKKTGQTVMPKAIKAIAEDKGWNINNAVIEMYRWRRFNGFIGRQKG